VVDNWVVQCYSSAESPGDNLILDGKNVGQDWAVAAIPKGCQMSINGMNSEQSDFEFSDLIIWDQALSKIEMTAVSNALRKKLNPSYEFPVVPEIPIDDNTIDYDSLVDIPAWGIYRAADFDAKNKILKEARGNGRDAKSSGLIYKEVVTTGFGATVPIESITGNVRSSIIWPQGSIPKQDFSICSIARQSIY